MLDEVVLSVLATLGVGNKFLNNVKLVVTREDKACCLLLDLLSVLKGYGFLHLSANVPLKDRQKHLSCQNPFPQIRSGISVRVLRVAAIAHVSCSVATLIERKEECLLALKVGSHSNFVQVHCEVNEEAVIEVETELLLISVFLELPLCVGDRLPRELVLQFESNDWDAVQ